MFDAIVITVSDRSYNKVRDDLSGPALKNELVKSGYSVKDSIVVPDDIELIKEALLDAAEKDTALIITTGGTGLSPRDVTPEATLSVCERLVPGISEQMRADCVKITKRAMLSRGVSGICKRSLIVNLPGSPKAAVENLSFVLPCLEHGLIMLREKPIDCADIKD